MTAESVEQSPAWNAGFEKGTESAFTEPGKASPATLVADAVPGNRRAVARAYGHAATWLESGRQMPPELARWTGERLRALARVLNDAGDKKLEGVNRALGLSEGGKRGRKPSTPMEEAQRRGLVYDVLWQKTRYCCTDEEAFRRVKEFHELASHWITETQIEKAWKSRRKLIPEMES